MNIRYHCSGVDVLGRGEVVQEARVWGDGGDGRDNRRQLRVGLRRRPGRVIIVHAFYSASFEHHLVLRQSPRLVAEQVTDLT